MNPPPTPEECLARYREAGDPADLAALFDLAAPDLFRVALHLCPDAASAEDALQETFLAVMEHPDRYDPGRPARPWLATILRHHASKGRRRDARRPDPDRAPRPADPDDPAALAESAEEKRRVQEAMQALPEPYRGVALLRWRYGLEPAEIADVRGVPPGTVWSLLSRALRRLRTGMGALPAILSVGGASGRGIEGVRAAVLRRAGAKAAAAGTTGAAAAATTGGFLMANKAAAIGAAALLLGAAGWFALRGGAGGGETGPAPAGSSVSQSDTLPAPPPPPPAAPAAPAAAEPAYPPPVDLENCDRDLDLFGLVVDGDGAPVPGARVESSYRTWNEGTLVPRALWGASTPGPATVSSVDGSFALRLGRGDHVTLRASKEGVGAASLPWRVAGERVRIVLAEGATLLLRAKDGDGKPVEGARVLAYRFDRRSIETLGEGATGPDGAWTLGGLPPGTVAADVEHPVLAWGRIRPTALPASGTLEVEVVLAPGRLIEGSVLADVTGEPVAGAVVGESWVMHRPVRSGPDGRYAKPGVSTEFGLSLYARAEGYARAAVFEAEEGRADFRLRPGDVLVGRVLSPEGDPAAGARVAVAGNHMVRPGYQDTDTGFAVADGEGRFRIGGLRHDVLHTLLVESPGAARLLIETGAPSEEGGTLDLGDLRLGESRAIEGRVVDAAGEPLPDRGVVLAGPAGKWSGERYVNRLTRRSDDLGRFRFHDLGPGSYEVSLSDEGGNVPAKASVELGAEKDVLDVVLGMPTGGEIRVLATDPEGNPLPGIALGISGPDYRRSAKSGEDGRAVFDGVPKGETRVSAFDTGRPHRWVSEDPSGTVVPPGTAEVRLVLHPVGVIRGRVVGPDGKGLEGEQVHYHPPEKPFGQIAVSAADGSFELGPPAGKPMVIELYGYVQAKGPQRQVRSSFRTEPVTVTGPAEGVELRALPVENDRTLTVRLLDLEDRPLPGFAITYFLEGSNSFPITDGNGEVRLEGLRAEEVQFGVSPQGVAPDQPDPVPEGAVLPANVKVMPEGQVVTLRLRKGVPFEGIVLDSGGAPAEGATVMIQTADYAVSQGRTDGAGRFKVWIAPDAKLLMGWATTSGPEGPKEMKQIQGEDLEKRPLEFRLEPWKGR